MGRQNIHELLKSFSREDYGSTVDLHIHTFHSDGKLSPEAIVEDAEKKGLKYFSITDHNTVTAYKECPSLLENERVIPGVEFDCWHQGVLVHILGYGIDVNDENIFNFCAKTIKGTEVDIVRLFNNRKPKDVIDAIHKAGGIASLAHPACCWCPSLDWFVKSLVNLGLDGLEVYYPYARHRGIIKFHLAKTVEKIALKYNLIMTGGSDSHEHVN